MKVAVGDRFQNLQSIPYREKDGTKKDFKQTRIVEVTAVEGNNASYKTVCVLKEEDRPSWDTTNFLIGSKGGFSISANEELKMFSKVSEGRYDNGKPKQDRR